MYPSDVWCEMKCIRDDYDCLFKGCCGYQKQYLRVFFRKRRHAIHRYSKYNDDDGNVAFNELISLSKVYLKTGFKCYYCGRKMSIGISNAPDTCSIDHRTALAKGGNNDLSNIVFCCEECNINKGSHDTVLNGLIDSIEKRFPRYKGGDKE